jgi:major vault protein
MIQEDGEMSDERETKRDLVLPPGTYAYMQDVTKGVIKTYTGPTVINPSAQEVPIIYDPQTGTFKKVKLEEALKKAVVAVEQYYVVLLNPAKDNRHPAEASALPSEDLVVGRKINIPGPIMFGLWPGQAAEVIRGHSLHSNQYLLVRVYNEEEAKKNWNMTVWKPAAEAGGAPVAMVEVPKNLTVGKLLIIKGTEVSFYIPPTGITVVQDEAGPFVRNALTLERLEYCILIDENGKKRYEIGPKVVFPEPSERFIEDHSTKVPSKKFRAIELNPIQGLHIKVISDYTEGEVQYKAGDELFLTGKQVQIYFPREEHAVIKYDGKAKHFASAIPAGEGRYIMKRMTGDIVMERGPAMVLPDPRTEVTVRRPLTERQCTLWYPGNSEALEYNRFLRATSLSSPTTRTGVVSEGDVSRAMTKGGPGAAGEASKGGGRHSRTGGGYASMDASAVLYASAAPIAAAAVNSLMESSKVGGDQDIIGDEFSRASTYTQPRTVTLDTKYQGAPSITVWQGFSVQVTSKLGKQRVELGPKTVLLEYDEELTILSLSTGKPKTTDRLLETPYLRVENNVVSDLIHAETMDRVTVELRLSYLVNFEGDPNRWFSVENYVKFLCDHVRSVLKNRVKRLPVEEFYLKSTDFVRDSILGTSPEAGKPRPGMYFKENGMRVSDVEVLAVSLRDDRIRQMLDAAQHDVVRNNLEMTTLRRNLEVTKQKEQITREEQQTKADTQKKAHSLQLDLATSELSVILTKLGNELKQLEVLKERQMANEAIEDLKADSSRARDAKDQEMALAINREQLEIEIERLKAETQSVVDRFSSSQKGFSDALMSLSNNETMVKVAQAWDIQRTIGGESMADLLGRLFTGTPFKAVLENMKVLANGSAPAPTPTYSAGPGTRIS